MTTKKMESPTADHVEGEHEEPDPNREVFMSTDDSEKPKKESGKTSIHKGRGEVNEPLVDGLGSLAVVNETAMAPESTMKNKEDVDNYRVPPIGVQPRNKEPKVTEVVGLAKNTDNERYPGVQAPKGKIVDEDGKVEVEGEDIGNGFVKLSEPIWRKKSQPGSDKRWTYVLVHPAGAEVNKETGMSR